LQVGNKFHVYFTAREPTTNHLSIGVVTSDSPDGPYTTSDIPLWLDPVGTYANMYHRVSDRGLSSKRDCDLKGLGDDDIALGPYLEVKTCDRFWLKIIPKLCS